MIYYGDEEAASEGAPDSGDGGEGGEGGGQ